MTCAHVRSYPLDDDLILLDTRTQRVVVLNETAAFVWAGLEAGLAAGEVAATISAQTGVPLSEALRDCEALAAEWSAAGLVGSEAVGRRAAPNIASFRLGAFGFRLTGPDEALVAVRQPFAHLAVDPGSIEPTAPTLAITSGPGGWALSEDGRVLGESANLEQLVPLVHANVLAMAYGSQACLMAIHGAAVSRGGACVLLPGLPGNGKSTLTAALVAAGYDFCTDDLAMLAGDPLRLTPLPLRLGIKSGSWSALEHRIPELEALPEYRRADGKRTKYWLPPADRLPRADARLRVDAIVFPRFDESHTECTLAPVPRSRALLRVSEAGYHLQGRVDRAWLETTLEWLRTLSCYDLGYADLDEAVTAFASVFP